MPSHVRRSMRWAASVWLLGCGSTVEVVNPELQDGSAAVGDGPDSAYGADASDATTGADRTASCDGCSDGAVSPHDASKGRDAGDAGDAAPICVPRTCSDFPGGTCGQQADSCGGLTPVCAAWEGGVCAPGEWCGGGGVSLCGHGSAAFDACPFGTCVPLDCLNYPPGTCGQQSDGCGGLTANCSTCPSPLTCTPTGGCAMPSDGGPCAPSTCETFGFECGLFTDGCGSTIDCGACPAGEFCGGGGYHRCGGVCDLDAEVCGSVTCTSDAGTCVEDDPCLADGGCGLVRGRCSGLLSCGPCPGEGGPADAPSE